MASCLYLKHLIYALLHLVELRKSCAYWIQHLQNEDTVIVMVGFSWERNLHVADYTVTCNHIFLSEMIELQRNLVGMFTRVRLRWCCCWKLQFTNKYMRTCIYLYDHSSLCMWFEYEHFHGIHYERLIIFTKWPSVAVFYLLFTIYKVFPQCLR